MTNASAQPGHNYYQMCTKTIMDTSDPDIAFDENGVSNHWYHYQEVKKHLPYLHGDTNRIHRVVDRIKQDGKGKEYDCVMGVSGGVDSTYVAYLARQYGLRPLAIHFDNGWNSELAVDNIERILTALKIDLHTFVIDWEEFKDLQRAYLRASVVNAEVPTDHAIVATIYKYAARFGIKYLLSGSNITTEAIMPKAWAFDMMDATNLKAIHRRFGSGRRPTYPVITLPKFFRYTYLSGIHKVSLLDYAPYNKADAISTIEKEFGWRYYGGKHYESVFTRFYQGYILPTKFGYDKRRAHLSTLICSGQMTREEALEEIQKPSLPAEMATEDREYVTRKLGMTDSEFDEIMRTPPRSHLDFPNEQKWMKLALQLKNMVNPRT